MNRDDLKRASDQLDAIADKTKPLAERIYASQYTWLILMFLLGGSCWLALYFLWKAFA